jgi:hypothetical protein
MKSILTLIATLFTALLISAQTPKLVFDPASLTPEELKDIKAFNEKKGQPRWDEFQKIIHIFPTCQSVMDSSGTTITYDEETVSMIMTREQLEQLIGKPDFENGSYEIGKKQYDCEVSFSSNANDEILSVIFANCKDYFTNLE